MATFDVITSSPLITASITLLSIGLAELLRRRHMEKVRAREWYDVASGYLSNLKQVSERATRYRDGVNHEILRKGLSPLDEDMMRHANLKRKRVEEAARVELAVIAAYATGLASLTEKSAETDALDFVERVQQDAIENYEGDYLMEDLETLFSSFDIAKFADNIDRDIEIDDNTAEKFRSQFSDDSLDAGRPTSIQEALSMRIEDVREAFENDRGLRTVVDSSLEAFVTMLVGLGEDAHKRMKERRDRV